MAEENIRLELTKAFIVAGCPVAQIPAKVRSLEGFCEDNPGICEFASEDEAKEAWERESLLRQAAERQEGIALPGSAGRG